MNDEDKQAFIDQMARNTARLNERLEAYKAMEPLREEIYRQIEISADEIKKEGSSTLISLHPRFAPLFDQYFDAWPQTEDHKHPNIMTMETKYGRIPMKFQVVNEYLDMDVLIQVSELDLA